MIQTGMRFVIRARHNRVTRTAEALDTDWCLLKDVVGGIQGCFERDVPLSARKKNKRAFPVADRWHPPRKARVARLEFSAAAVTIKRPEYGEKSLPLSLPINVIHVKEIDPPEGEPAVEWLLYTTESIQRIKDVIRLVDIYRSRWLIEEFYGALKTGCLYQERQFESRAALLNILALSLPIACAILLLRSQARSNTNVPATDVMSSIQLRILRSLFPINSPMPHRHAMCSYVWLNWVVIKNLTAHPVGELYKGE
jgi:hypothetical protein